MFSIITWAVVAFPLWSPVQASELLNEIPEKPSSWAVAPANLKLKPMPERCHQRKGYEISFSLSCAASSQHAASFPPIIGDFQR